MKYIDAEKLIAEIDRRKKICAEVYLDEAEKGNKQMGEYYHGKSVAFGESESLIASLQQEQPEVDLEKALNEYYKNADFGPSEAIEYEIHKDIARHFYELGKAGKA